MSSALLERSFTGVLVIVVFLVVALVALRSAIGWARRRSTQRTDALLKRTLEPSAPTASTRIPSTGEKADGH